MLTDQDRRDCPPWACQLTYLCRCRAARHHAPYAACAWVLVVFFAFRVLAQLVQRLHSVPWLPAFDTWQGSGLPYEILLSAQALILLAMSRLAWRLSTERIQPRARRGVWYLAIGAIYFVTMLLRLLAAVTGLVTDRWSAAALPALFHLVLASFVLLVGAFHWCGAYDAPAAPALKLHHPARWRSIQAWTLARTVRRSSPSRRAVSR